VEEEVGVAHGGDIESGGRKAEEEEARAEVVMLEILGLAHREFPIIHNKSQRRIHPWWVATL
jgi:hypothetical protein